MVGPDVLAVAVHGQARAVLPTLDAEGWGGPAAPWDWSDGT